MVNVAQVVRKYVKDHPFVQEALSRGVINNAALAEELIPKVQEELGKEVKFSAVNMAIRRVKEQLEKSFSPKAKFDESTDIVVRSNLVEITVFKMENVQEYLKKIYNLINLRKGDFLTMTHGLHEVMIITNSKYEKRITEIFPKSMIKKLIRNISSITINLSEESYRIVGLFYLITRALAWENISIVDVVSTFTEWTVTVDEKDTAKAFNVLSNAIKENL